MSLEVNVICRNYKEDRVIPRFARYLSDHLGWSVTSRPAPGADVYYLSAYFEYTFMRGDLRSVPMAAYFTHREEQPPDSSKARAFDQIGQRVDLRIATASKYAELLQSWGDTVQISAPVERERFLIPKRAKNQRMIAGFSGYTYPNKRKGEDLARAAISSPAGKRLEWRASGRGWPVPTKKLPWCQMPAFYQSLDILVITALVEGIPMPPLEVLSCGVSIVIPRDVGLLDELRDCAGIHRYEKGDKKSLILALQEAIEARSSVDREALRAISDPYTITAWCEQHRAAIEEVFC